MGVSTSLTKSSPSVKPVQEGVRPGVLRCKSCHSFLAPFCTCLLVQCNSVQCITGSGLNDIGAELESLQ